MPLSPFVKTGGAAGARFVSLAASRLFVRSINKSRAIVLLWWVCQIDCHFPSGHFSVAMRSFAQVEHLHILHRPVPFSDFASHSSQDLQIDSLKERTSFEVAGNPLAQYLMLEFVKFCIVLIISALSITMIMKIFHLLFLRFLEQLRNV